MSTERLMAALAGRYRIERQLGRGGMATVHLATDLRLARRVAIKVVDPQVAGLLSADRFLQEIRLMAGLQHPHILPLFDSGEVEGELFYVMPFVEGETLRERIVRERRLGVDEAVRIAREVASALDFAHRNGILHRDIKPENILLSDGHALVADFGIARAVLADRDAAARLTATGLTLGTPGYMSPEQASGDTVVDARSDIYALGVVTHEMLAGEPPFTGPSAQAVLARVLTEAPPPLTQLRPSIPASLSAAVQKAIATEPSDRFSGAQEFTRALGGDGAVASGRGSAARTRRRLALLAGAVMLAALGFAVRPWLAGAAPPAVRLAVLPLRESGVVVRPGFAVGVINALRADLATLPNVDVIAGASIDALGDSARSPRFVADQLGATHVLTGSLQWDQGGDGIARVRITPELITIASRGDRATAGVPIVDRVEDLFETQARVSQQIATTLGVEVSAEAALRLARPPTRNRAAYEAWLRAGIDFDHEADLLNQAVALDSNFALAWAQLGQREALSFQGTLDARVAAAARDASARAMALDSNLAAARLARALYERHVERDFSEAVRHGMRAMELAPGDAAIMHFTAAALWNARRTDEALALARRAAALDPRNASAVARVATLLIWRREFAAAEAQTGRALAVAGRDEPFINLDSIVLPLARGDLAGARRFTASLDSSIGPSVGFAMQQWFLGWAFDAAQSDAGLAELRALRQMHAYHVTIAARAAFAHDLPRQKAYADSARAAALERLAQLPREDRLHVALGYAYALGGSPREALAQADSVSASRSAWHDGFLGAVLSLNVAEIRAAAGDTAHAIALLDSLLSVPGFVTPRYLAIDPWFDGIRGDRRFRALLARAP